MFPPLQNLFQFPKEDLKPNQEPRLKDNREKKKD
jgi:hypothetical protein